VVVSSFELALGANHDVHVSERGEFGVGTGRIAAEFGLVRRRPILLGVERIGLALLSGPWLGEQPAGDEYECSEGSPRLRRTVHANGFSVMKLLRWDAMESTTFCLTMSRQGCVQAYFPCYSRNFTSVTISLHCAEF
jgi:hypothetical protein